MTRLSRSCRKKLLPVPERCAWALLPKLRPMLPSSWSIGVPSWVPDEKYRPRRCAFTCLRVGSKTLLRKCTIRPFSAPSCAAKPKMAMRATGSVSSCEPVRHLLGQALHQRVEFGRSRADHVQAAIRGLECRAPYLASACFIEAAEILHETGDQIGLGEQHIDGELDLQDRVDFLQTAADFGDMGIRLLAAVRHQIGKADRQDDAVYRLPARDAA